MTDVNQILAQGTQLHQAGRLAEAERAYRHVLAAEPRQPHALHQLGMLALQARQFPAAIDLISQAIRADRSQPAFYANLGEAYRHSGRTDEAAESYRKALQLNPGLATAHMLLGTLLHDAGRLDEAAAALREALRLQPDDPQARSRLGLVLDQQGKHSEAEACFRRVLRSEDTSAGHFNLASVLNSLQRDDEAIAEYQAALTRQPDLVEAHNNLGTIYKSRGQIAEAERHFLAAAQTKEPFAAAHINLGLVRLGQGRLEEAAASYRRALEIEPAAIVARHGLGTVLQKLGRTDEARACFELALAADPTHADSHLSLSYLYQLEGRYPKAIVHCEQALRLRPDSPEAYNNLCVAYAGQGQQDEAIAAARQAIAIKPQMAQAHGNLALSLQALGLLDEALAEHREAIEIDPQASGFHSNLLYTLNYHPAYDAQTLFAEHLNWAERHADPLTAASAQHINDRSPGRRLRVGYVSPHFCAHAVNFFTEPVLAAHDHQQFEIFCYSDVDQPDDTTAALRGHADAWREIYGRTNEDVAEMVRADKIDVLVDLTGHISGGERMLLFARKPAPIQVTYIGYQNSTGMRAMDYRLTDAYSDPPGQTDALHTERLERLPTTFFCYQPSTYAPPESSPPAEANGYVTFGSVNAFTKITPQVLETWSEILRGVPNSRLVIRADMTPSLQARLRETFARQGIEAERLELVNRLPRPEYLKLIARLDVALDPFPFNGHTTTCDCLWQGVPVITLSGETYVSRFGGSALATLGLTELIAGTREEYVAAAVALGQDGRRLAGYRAGLREKMAASPLLDFAGFTRNLEAAYREMWQRWCGT